MGFSWRTGVCTAAFACLVFALLLIDLGNVKSTKNFNALTPYFSTKCVEETRTSMLKGLRFPMLKPITLHNITMEGALIKRFIAVRYDWSFEEQYRQMFGCTMRTFDPSMGNTTEHEHSPGIYFYPMGLSDKKERTKKGWNMDSFSGFLKRFNEEKRTISYLKFDIEGYEWRVLANLLKDGVLNNVMQLSLEMHVENPPDKLRHQFELLKQLEDAGFLRYYVTHYRPKPRGKFIYQSDNSYINSRFLLKASKMDLLEKLLGPQVKWVR